MFVEEKGTRAETQPCRPSPVSRIDKIASLRKFSDSAQALDVLHVLARAVAPIINERRFHVGLLSEMDPRNPCLLGLNVNHGQKILIRLRPSHNKSVFYPMGDLIGTFLHELCHNAHGPHNAAFYALLDSLKKQYETASYLRQYFAEEVKLGSTVRAGLLHTQRLRDLRIKKFAAGMFKAEKRRLGGLAIPIGNRRAAMLEAAERRSKDSQWCADAVAGDVPRGKDLEEKEFIDLTVIENDGRDEAPERKGKTQKTEKTETNKERTGKVHIMARKEIECIDLTED